MIVQDLKPNYIYIARGYDLEALMHVISFSNETMNGRTIFADFRSKAPTQKMGGISEYWHLDSEDYDWEFEELGHRRDYPEYFL